MSERQKNVLKIGGLLLVLVLVIMWRVIDNNVEKEKKPIPSFPDIPSNNNNEEYEKDNHDYEAAHENYDKDPNTEATDNPTNPLASDPIWKLTNGVSNKIVQVDFMISIFYSENHIRLDIKLSMTNDELKEPERYKETYINIVQNYLKEKDINVNNYEINYIVPNNP